MGIFPDARGQLTPQSLVESGPNSNLSEILWLSSLPASMKKIRSKMKALERTLSVAMETRSYQVQNLMQSIPHPNDASDKIWLRLAHWLRRYSSLKMFTDAQTNGLTDALTDGRRIDRYTISSPLSLRLR